MRLNEDWKSDTVWYSFDEVLEGMNGNVDDESIDSFLRNTRSLARFLKCKQDNLIIYRTDAEYSASVNYITKVKEIRDITVYKLDNVMLGEEKLNGEYFLYFTDEESAEFYFSFLDNALYEELNIKKDCGDPIKNAEFFNHSMGNDSNSSLTEADEIDDDYFMSDYTYDNEEEVNYASEKPDIDAVRAADVSRGDKIITDYTVDEIEPNSELIITDVIDEDNGMITIQALDEFNEVVELIYDSLDYIGRLV